MTDQVIHWLTAIVTICSLLHTLLPPWEFLNDFPSVQKYYKVVVYIIGYMALNGRSTVYQTISTKSGTQVSEAVAKSPEQEAVK